MFIRRWEEAGEHKLLVTATDSTGKTSKQEVLLVVQAVNNLPPTFPEKLIKFEIPETHLVGDIIGKVHAHDPDGQDAALKYRIDFQPVGDLFVMEESTGILRLNGPLDFEKGPRSYKIKVMAQDLGTIPESGDAFVEINVTDVNDEQPKFLFSRTDGGKNFAVEISESSMPEIVVMTLRAQDMDSGAELEYSIECPCQSWEASGAMGSESDSAAYFKSLR